MGRLLLLFWILGSSFLQTYAQYSVYKDSDGQVITKYDTYYSSAGGTTSLINSASHNEVFYLGSPFLTFPVWQAGKIQVDKRSRELYCKLAYNLETNEVLCRFPGDSTTRILVPELFTIDNTEFTRQLNSIAGIDYQLYSNVLYNGQTKLLVSLSKKLEKNLDSNIGYKKTSNFKGIYHTKTTYHIRKGNAKPELINLSKKSLLTVLYEQAEKISSELPSSTLTVNEVVSALKHYDSLMVVTQADKPRLNSDAVFNQILHEKVSYPSIAWYNGIYGRVYAGFDIDPQGLVKNIAILSPTNGGFGFVEEVKSGLERLPRLDPILSGKYILPVAFTYTNSKEKIGPHIPVNSLSPDRMDSRIVLDELVVPVVISKPVINTKEVWGYYK